MSCNNCMTSKHVKLCNYSRLDFFFYIFEKWFTPGLCVSRLSIEYIKCHALVFVCVWVSQCNDNICELRQFANVTLNGSVFTHKTYKMLQWLYQTPFCWKIETEIHSFVHYCVTVCYHCIWINWHELECLRTLFNAMRFFLTIENSDFCYFYG